MVLNWINFWIKNSLFLINVVGVTIILFFSVDRLWKFFIIFELVIIPIVLIIIGWGRNIARIPSSLYIYLYTLAFSLPSLYVIIINFKVLTKIMLCAKNDAISLISLFILFIIMAVKTPLYGVHYWLPKAHVEASTSGSIILAGGLLKIGRFGIAKIVIWGSIKMWNLWITLGAAFRAFLCSCQRDFKKLIALRSVSHITLASRRFLTNLNFRILRLIVLSFIHSIVRSIIFFMRGILQSISHSRLIFYFPKFISSNLLVLIIVYNLSLPPIFTFIAEIIMLTNIFIKRFSSALFLFLILIFTIIYFHSCVHSIKNSNIYKEVDYAVPILLILVFSLFNLPILIRN